MSFTTTALPRTGARFAPMTACVFALAVAVPVAAQVAGNPPAAPLGRWHLSSSLGFGSAGGDYGDIVEDPVSFDLNISRARSASWRFGVGFEFGSLVMKPPYEEQEDWSRIHVYALGSRIFNPEGRVRPYLQGRAGLARMHPRSEVLHVIPPEEFEEGHNPTESENGLGLTAIAGVELGVTPGLALDLSAYWTSYWTSDLDLSAIGRESAGAGNEWQLRGGLTWRPLAEPAPRDAWGAPRSWGWATGEMLAINFVASLLNEYTRGESSYPVTPRTMKYNFERGWKYDDNEFRTNQLIHPFNGGTYFNSARDNGIGFWGSSVMALAGAFIWECCGESQPMSWNDMVSTGIGGISRGEVGHRVSGLILDNRSSGDGRFWREIAAGLFDPVGWFNRLLSGRGSQVGENPGNPYDWRPPNVWLHVAAGFRIMGEGESITENTHAYGLLQADLAFGNAFTNESRRPFDRFDAGMQLNVGDKTGVGRIEIRGDIWSTPLGETEGEVPRHVFAVTQDFDYVDNEAYEYGGQGLGLTLFSRFGGGRTAIKSRVTTYVVAGAAVNADYSFLADIPDPRQLRDYDYGAGAGGALEFVLDRPWGPLAFLGYRYTLIDVRNGSIYNPTEGPPGSNAKHQVHRTRLAVFVPFGERLTAGGEAALFFRDSRYDDPELIDQTQRNPEARVFLGWTWGPGRAARPAR